jgi:TRAP-type C4-dicarboxylate transport system permease small subunit
MASPLLAPLVHLVVLADELPEPEDVKAGWVAFALFIGGILVVAFLGWSLTRHLRTAQANEEAGLFGSDEPADAAETDQSRSDKPGAGTSAE